jgi:putative ATP-dependent endonuclease of the OLD family
MGSSAICLVDEIEQGLEPYRIVQVLRQLCDNRVDGQVVLTSHSPMVLIARNVDELRFVRNQDGIVTVEAVNADFTDAVQPIARSRGRAFLGKKILACEGQTEEGLCRALDDYWAARHNGEGLAYRGIVAVECQGQNAEPYAMEFARLGYPTALLCDSDRPLSIDRAHLKTAGIELVQWADAVSIEQRIALDLPLTNLQKLLEKAYELHEEVRVLDACQSTAKTLFPNRDIVKGRLVSDWIAGETSEAEVRNVVGLAAKQTLKGWFKNVELGIELGLIVKDALPSIEGTDLSLKLDQLEAWLYGN